MSASELILCRDRFTSSSRYDLVVVHTNEGQEGARTARGLALYLQHVQPGYHLAVDEGEVVACARDFERVNGAGGVNSKAFHVCLTGRAAQDLSQWTDRSSKLAIIRAAEETRAACQRLGVPMSRTTDPRTGRGICGHVDVSRYYTASEGHTDPGAAFPWDLFLDLVTRSVPTAPALPAGRKEKPVVFIQTAGVNAIAVLDIGQGTKRIIATPREFDTLKWCMAINGLQVGVQMVDRTFWDDLRQIT